MAKIHAGSARRWAGTQLDFDRLAGHTGWVSIAHLPQVGPSHAPRPREGPGHFGTWTNHSRAPCHGKRKHEGLNLTMKALFIMVAAAAAAYFLVPELQRRFGKTPSIRSAILVAVALVIAYLAFALTLWSDE